jgi:hypothetical protein
VNGHDRNPAVAFMTEGSINAHLSFEKVRQLRPRQRLSAVGAPAELDGDVHVVDRNASGTQPAKFLVLLIKDKGAPALMPAQ